MSGALLERDVAPDLISPVEAWRAWRIVDKGGKIRLASVVKRTVWPTRAPLVARCLRARSPLDWLRRREQHFAPTAECRCGIYGAELAIAGRYLAEEAMESFRVIGCVSLWGCVVECEHGFRASAAYPLRLYVPAGAVPRGYDARELAAGLGAYGVDVELLDARGGDALAALTEQQGVQNGEAAV